jgi:DNA-binding response OmpR family regulator
VNPPESKGRVLIVEDDPTVSEVVTRYLQRDGFAVEIVGDGRSALAAVEKAEPDIVVLDIMLPGMDGLEVCRWLRASRPTPIIMLTALGEESDRIAGLEMGADDYLAKPFSPRELVARVNAILRRARAPLTETDRSDPIVAGSLCIDVRSHEVKRDGRLLALTAREFDLLAHLARHPRQVFTREELLEQVWGYTFGDKSTVTVHVRRLREKVESDPARPEHVVTVWGVGYRFDP